MSKKFLKAIGVSLPGFLMYQEGRTDFDQYKTYIKFHSENQSIVNGVGSMERDVALADQFEAWLKSKGWYSPTDYFRGYPDEQEHLEAPEQMGPDRRFFLGSKPAVELAAIRGFLNLTVEDLDEA